MLKDGLCRGTSELMYYLTTLYSTNCLSLMEDFTAYYHIFAGPDTHTVFEDTVVLINNEIQTRRRLYMDRPQHLRPVDIDDVSVSSKEEG